MKVQTVVIGEYQMSPAVSFCLYQLPSPIVTPPISQTKDQPFINYYCLEDLFAIFDLHAATQDIRKTFQQFPGLFFKDVTGRSYIQARAMADIASKHQLCNLADLCLLEDDELLDGGAVPLLKMTTFVRLLSKPTCHVSQDRFEPRRLDGTEWFFHQNTVGHNDKLQIFSPTLPAFLSPANSPPSTPPLSSSFSMSPSNQTSSTMQLPKPSSLLLKRLAPKHGSKKNLTILTPPYTEESNHGVIQSAPLRRTTIMTANRILKRTQKAATVNNRKNPASATPASSPRFPSPPIVPSQQPAWHQYRPSSKTRKPTVTTTMSQKQKFLQPFEFLYDQIEQTKQLKTSLDDQIRRSSSLIQTLQQPNYVESVVRRQVRDDSVTRRLENRLLDCVERVTRLEERLASGTKLDDTISQLSDRIQQLEAKLASSSQ